MQFDSKMKHLYQGKLHNFAQKRHIGFPAYEVQMQGPPHLRFFKARVTIYGVTYKGPGFCNTVKEAKHAAAKVALMSLLLEGTLEDDCLYKSVLYEWAQKYGFIIPIYVTNITGPPHIPIFASTVKIAGEHFSGQEAPTKKQAEINAAKVAYTALIEDH